MRGPPSSELHRVFDRGTVDVAWRGASVKLRTAHGLFSADRLDDGTRLLLDHLPAAISGRVLDVGCGYGALSLPIACVEHDARLLCIDRDVLAVRYAARNAEALALHDVEVRASLGYDAVPERGFSLVLCNVPARIGRAGLAHLVLGALRRLDAAGELRIVVIRDLASVVESIAGEHALRSSRVADGARHSVFSFAAHASEADEDPALYARDSIECAGLAFERPHDASEDPGHAREGAPLLAELLPRAPKGDALVWRSAHGVMSVLLAQRGARVVHADRDLLALAFARRNAARHAVQITMREGAWLPEVIEGQLTVLVMELSSTAGERAARAELAAARSALVPSGHALVLAQAKLASAIGLPVLATRGAWIVARLAS
jgi:16S rRNA (guanine1207-N2)-methyltransferase